MGEQRILTTNSEDVREQVDTNSHEWIERYKTKRGSCRHCQPARARGAVPATPKLRRRVAVRVDHTGERLDTARRLQQRFNDSTI